VHAHEKVFARKSAFYLRLIRTNRHRICVLNDHGGDRRTTVQCFPITGEDRTDAGLVEHTYGPIPDVEPLGQGLVELEDVRTDVERTTPFVLPSARDRGDAAGSMHVRGTVA